jgi:riboflavin kinase/FMN adenylyltransferase
MKVHRDIQSLPQFKNAVVTIGTFDGVHLGHQQILQQLKEEAVRIDGETVIITFDPHPRKIVAVQKPSFNLLNTPDEKTLLLNQHGIDHVVIVPFTTSFANQSATEYVNDFLIRYFQPHTLIIGYDHKFGKGREGDFHLLETFSKEKGFTLIEIPQHVINESAISSTRIRERLLQGKIEEANELLGYTYFMKGKVVEGNKLGRTIGYPTANLSLHPEKLVPGNGVYAVRLTLQARGDSPAGNVSLLHPGQAGSRDFQGMMNIGVRPTVDGTKRVIEVNIFDFDEDIYGQQLHVEAVSYLRGEEKFSGLEQLKAQLGNDKVHALKILNGE